MFLTRPQIAALTGTPQRRRQIAWLSERGYLFEVNLAGQIVLAEAEVARHLVGGKREGTESAIRWGELKHGRKAA